MQRSLGVIFILASFATLLLIGWIGFNGDYWISPPKEKFLRSWRDDVHLLEKTKTLPPAWKEIREITLKADPNSPADGWIQDIVVPVERNPKGKYRLEVFVIHWIDGYRYGAVVQYDLVDLSNDNTTWELGRTFKLGFVY